jgi:hypothetical protein
MVWEFWEYVTLEFSAWRDRLPKTERAILDEKMRLIRRNGTNVSCLKGPLGKYRHIYKVRAQGPSIAMRPLLCKGPYSIETEFTVLKPMIEINWKDEPPSAKDDAERRRLEIIADKRRRVPYEVPEV